MMSSILTPLLIIIIPLALLFLPPLLSKPPSKNREKLSPFECGFDPLSKARTPFSIRFFLLGILFVIFDIEIALIVPLPLMTQKTPSPLFYLSASIFLILLMLGLMQEWHEGSLNWAE